VAAPLFVAIMVSAYTHTHTFTWHVGRSKEGRKFALKIIRKERISAEQEMALGAELALIRRLHHPRLLQLIDELDTPVEWYFIMELFNVCPLLSTPLCYHH